MTCASGKPHEAEHADVLHVAHVVIEGGIAGDRIEIGRPEFATKVGPEGLVDLDCRHVSAADAPGVVAGYLVCNDVSGRDWQMASPTQTMGKSFDTHGPLGPWLVTPDELDDVQNLRVRTWVNDELRQDYSTADMVYSCSQMIEHLSKAMTLEPGDVITTGTPVGNGVLREPPRCGKRATACASRSKASAASTIPWSTRKPESGAGGARRRGAEPRKSVHTTRTVSSGWKAGCYACPAASGSTRQYSGISSRYSARATKPSRRRYTRPSAT